MGVDKPNVGLVVHYDISDSLENYVQEAGRAGRDEGILADCYVLFNASEDLDKHFTLLNQTKLSVSEIKQIWRAIKELCGVRPRICESALQIARQAGWNDGRPDEIETRVKTAILALEDAGYIKRGQNMPRVFATSIISKNAIEAIDKINASTLIYPDEKESARRIIKKLFSQKSQASTDEDGESRVDYLADVLGLKIERVVRIVTWLTEEGILANQQDLQAFIGKNTRTSDSMTQLNRWLHVEKAMLDVFAYHHPSWSLKEFAQQVQDRFPQATPKHINTLINFWRIKNHLGRDEENGAEFVLKQDLQSLNNILARKAVLGEFVVRHISELSKQSDKIHNDWIEVNFSVGELKHAFNQGMWANAKQQAVNYLATSVRLSLLQNIMRAFEQSCPNRKYVSDWRVFIKESKLEHFYHPEKGVVTLSTIHKAKGREFDSVFVLIDHKNIQPKHLPYGKLDDVKKREFYVAFSRAKSHLTVVSNSMAVNELLPKEGVDWLTYQGNPLEFRELVRYLKLDDVYLDWFYKSQIAIEPLRAGATLSVFANQYYQGCCDEHGNQVAVFSKKFKNELAGYFNKGYQLVGAKVNFIVLWQNKDKQHQKIRIVLPMVYLQKYH